MNFCHLRNVSVHMEQREILRDCNLQLHLFESTAIIGQSGAGKTSLGKIICFLQNPSKGYVSFNEEKIGTLGSKKFKRNVQLVFQNPTSALNPIMSVKQILLEPLIIHDLPYSQDLLIKTLEMVGLKPHLLTHLPYALSGGQQQRLCLARALILKPKVLVLDEVTCSLDLYTQAQIIQLLIKLRQEQNLTFIFISHDLALTNHLCERFIVMHDKTIVDDCRSVDLFNQDRSGYTKMLLNACQKLGHGKKKVSIF